MYTEPGILKAAEREGYDMQRSSPAGIKKKGTLYLCSTLKITAPPTPEVMLNQTAVLLGGLVSEQSEILLSHIGQKCYKHG